MKTLLLLNKVQGVHLLETVCVLMFMSSLAYWVMPSIRGISEGLRLKQTNDRLTDFLQSEFLRASQQEKTISIEIRRGSLQTKMGPAPSRSLTLPKKIFLSSRAALLKAYPRGVVSPATLRLHFGKRTCKITISLRARIRSSCA